MLFLDPKIVQCDASTTGPDGVAVPCGAVELCAVIADPKDPARKLLKFFDSVAPKPTWKQIPATPTSAGGWLCPNCAPLYHTAAPDPAVLAAQAKAAQIAKMRADLEALEGKPLTPPTPAPARAAAAPLTIPANPHTQHPASQQTPGNPGTGPVFAVNTPPSGPKPPILAGQEVALPSAPRASVTILGDGNPDTAAAAQAALLDAQRQKAIADARPPLEPTVMPFKFEVPTPQNR